MLLSAVFAMAAGHGGTIVIREQIKGGPQAARAAMPFTGDLSGRPGGFTLRGGRALTFRRPAGATWTVVQGPVPNYKIASVSCTSITGKSAALTDNGTLSVALMTGDTVTCTFVTHWVPPVGNLTIEEITEGGKGSFSYIVEPHDDPTEVTATTTQAGVPAEARPERNLALLAGELYSVQQLSPHSARGRWSLVGAECNGRRLKLNVYDLRLVNGKNTVCAFTNRFSGRRPASRSRRRRACSTGGSRCRTTRIRHSRTAGCRPSLLHRAPAQGSRSNCGHRRCSC